MAVIDNYKEFRDLAKVGCPPPEISRMVLEKSRTLGMADQCGIRVPKTKVISNSEQLRDLCSSFPFPWVLKPRNKELTVEEIKSSFLKTAAEVNFRFPQPRDFNPPMLLQEYCDGVGVGVELLIHRGECLAAFQHRRLEEVPYTGGVSVTAVAESLDPVLFENSLRLLRALQWEGPTMVEYKIKPEDGTSVLMEINGRYWGTISLAIAAGIDFPLYHWQVLHGETPSIPKAYTIGTRWKWTAGHAWRLHDLLITARGSRSARSELLCSLSGAAKLLDGSTPDPLFSASDPMPAIFDCLQVWKQLSYADTNALLRRLRNRSRS